jgi:hypothetical protein
MKKLMGSLLIVLMLTWLIAPVAESVVVGPPYTPSSVTVGPIQVTAEIVPVLQLSLIIHDGADLSKPVVTVMNFDKLVLDQSKYTYASSHVFTVEATALSSGRKYTITQTGTQLTAPTGEKLPVGCQIITPNAINAAPATGGTYGTQQTWVVTSGTVYTSNAAGQHDVINARYSLSSDPGLGSYDNIDADSHSGVYSATVTYTLTLN